MDSAIIAGCGKQPAARGLLTHAGTQAPASKRARAATRAGQGVERGRGEAAGEDGSDVLRECVRVGRVRSGGPENGRQE